MRDYGAGHRGVGFAAFGCGKDRLLRTRRRRKVALQHGHNVVWAGIANPCLHFAQRLGRDLSGDCAIVQVNAQDDAWDADSSSHPATQQKS
jgi:hypothetical protein